MINNVSVTDCPLAAGSFRNWMRLLVQHMPIQKKYIARATFVGFVSLFFAPFRILSRLIFNKQIEKTIIQKDPVFIIGHFRSGTTYLQNLLSQDKQFGYITTTQTLLPEMFLLGKWVNKLLRLFLPETRPMDNIKMAPEFPEEPEHAIGNLSPYCFYHGFCFPQQLQSYHKKYVLFENIEDSILSKWKSDYLYIIKSATYAFKGKQIFIKNPPDTARISTILEMFPNAKFIFLYRNPFVMFPSIKNFYSKSMRDWQFNEINDKELDENIFFIYESMLKKYEETKHLIPDHQLVEIKFEELERNPLETMRQIYEELKLSGFENAQSSFFHYAASQKNYEKNKYKLPDELIHKISSRWKEDIQRWKYESSFHI